MAESTTWLWVALLAYALALAVAWRWPGSGLGWLWTALGLHTVSLGWRWLVLGHGPFTTLHEILSSNLWSLALVFAVAASVVRELRHAMLPAGLVWGVLGAWLALTDAAPGHMPATYDTPLLYLHTVVGKLFLGLLLVALAAGAVTWWRRTARGQRRLVAAADDGRLDMLCYRFAAFALVFDSLMLIVGAVWAQDA
jgi:ABC-type transport system involved in cytochrome c biogenesis permease subunit